MSKHLEERLAPFRGHSEQSYVIAIVIFALLVQLVFSFVLFEILQEPLSLGEDPDEYGRMAKNIAEGHGFAIYANVPTTYRGPGYPYPLAGLYELFGDDFRQPTAFLQSILAALTVALVFYIGKRFARARVGYLAALLAAVHPLLIWYTPRFRYEPLFTFLFMLAVFFALRVKDNRQPRDAAFMGVFFGLSALVNQISLPLVLGLFLVLLVLQFKEWKALLLPMGVAVGTAILVILPWMIRNYNESGGRLIPVHEGGVTQFVKGNYEFELYDEAPLRSVELADLASVELAKLLDRDPNSFDVRSEGLDEDLRSHAVDYVEEHPDKLVAKVTLQSLRFWYVSETPRKSYIVGTMQLVFILPALLGIYAGLRAHEKRQGTLFLLAIVVYFNLVYAATHVEARYSTPIIPIVVIFAASGLVYGYECWKLWRAKEDDRAEDTEKKAPVTA